MKAKTLMNKIIIVGGLSACLLLGGCGAGQGTQHLQKAHLPHRKVP